MKHAVALTTWQLIGPFTKFAAPSWVTGVVEPEVPWFFFTGGPLPLSFLVIKIDEPLLGCHPYIHADGSGSGVFVLNGLCPRNRCVKTMRPD